MKSDLKGWMVFRVASKFDYFCDRGFHEEVGWVMKSVWLGRLSDEVRISYLHRTRDEVGIGVESWSLNEWSNRLGDEVRNMFVRFFELYQNSIIFTIGVYEDWMFVSDSCSHSIDQTHKRFIMLSWICFIKLIIIRLSGHHQVMINPIIDLWWVHDQVKKVKVRHVYIRLIGLIKSSLCWVKWSSSS